MKYPIYEHFYSFQGEGCHSGKAAYFIRFYGCPLKCGWCDSAGTWHKDYIPEHINKYSISELYSIIINNSKSNLVIITGGEPTIFDLSLFLLHCKELSSLKFHLETSGSFEIKGEFDWITLSPKWSKLPLIKNIQRANEIKIIVEDSNSIDKWVNQIPELKNKNNVWLHPEWSQRNNEDVLNTITEYVKNNNNFRAGYQIHKIYSADVLDKNSKAIIPLGGNIQNGY